MTKGFVIMAQGDVYVKCATTLKNSILKVMPSANITIITTDMLPHGDLGGFHNDWQVYECSPYDETIKLEADMIIPRNIDHWWDILSQKDIVVSSTIRNFMGEISDIRAYRKFIDDNSLPDVYNAITYFKKSDTAKQFFEIVRDVFENWQDYKAILKCNPQEDASTDWVYAIACLIMKPENTTMPGFTEMSMIHMKQFINGMPTEDWTDTLVYEILPDVVRVNTVPQLYPFHYHVKDFSDKLLRVV
jgi:hypothetical protein